MKTILRLFYTLIILVLIPTPALAQSPSLTLRLETADTTAFPATRLHLSAWNADGLPITDLTAEAFTLQEDGGAPFHPEVVASTSDAPLQVVLALDVSTSMSGVPLTDAKNAAARFLDHLTASDRAALLAFSDGVDPDPQALDPAREFGFSANFDPIYDQVESLQADGQTHLYNAAAKAVRIFDDQPPGHRAVLLLSDGRNEPADVGDPEEAIRLAKEANLPFFVIGLGNEIDEPYLRRLANETGGLFRSAPTSAELAHLFNDMAALLKTQYELSYTSKLPADGQAHTIVLTLTFAGGQATSEITTAPLPLIPTAEPSPTAPATPTDAPAPTDSPSATLLPATNTPEPLAEPAQIIAPTATALPPVEPAPPVGLLTSGIALVLIVLVVVLLLLARRKPRPTPEACAKCGFDLTGKVGACPQCGETRRLPRLK